MKSRLKKARVNVSELLHDAFLAKAARTKESNGMACMVVRRCCSLRLAPNNGVLGSQMQQQG